jgi:hypothetical protein
MRFCISRYVTGGEERICIESCTSVVSNNEAKPDKRIQQQEEKLE